MRREVKIGVFAVVMLGCLWGGLRQEFNRLPLLREKPERAEDKEV